MKSGDLFRTRRDAPPPLVEWVNGTDPTSRPLTETLPPGLPVVVLHRQPGALRRGRMVCVLAGGRRGWVWEDDLEPM